MVCKSYSNASKLTESTVRHHGVLPLTKLGGGITRLYSTLPHIQSKLGFRDKVSFRLMV